VRDERTAEATVRESTPPPSPSRWERGAGGEKAALPVEIEQFLYREAYLLDERRFRDWLGLFADDATYVISVRESVQRTDEGIFPFTLAEPPLVAEGLDFLTQRVKRLETHLAHAEQPPSLTRHLITNVLVQEERGAEVMVASNFQVYQARIDISEHVFFGKREDTLRRSNFGWRIARRHVVLDTSLLPRTLTILF
jgi:3-phenylpropionate/cinnamic acid dioxygenase small subunit